MKTDRITENEILDILGNGIPGINSELEKIAGGSNVPKMMMCFAMYTTFCARKGNTSTFSTCLNIAETLLHQGNHAVKNAVQNVYFFSVSSLLEIVTPLQKQIHQIIQTQLRDACVASGQHDHTRLDANHTL